MKKWISVSLAILVLSSIQITFNDENRVHAFSDQVIHQGASGEDVIELQARLQYLGFYNGKIDGVFGWVTYWALRNFQYEFDMEIDGMAGQATKQKLENASTYNKNYVHEQINKGNDFTHYGGVDKEKQTKPSSEDKQQQSAPSEDKKEQDQSS